MVRAWGASRVTCLTVIHTVQCRVSGARLVRHAGLCRNPGHNLTCLSSRRSSSVAAQEHVRCELWKRH